MNLDFIFLKDHSILQEIRKHKWIESEKIGRDIGFATAALDWMNNHYAAWSKDQKSRSRPATHARELAGHR